MRRTRPTRNQRDRSSVWAMSEDSGSGGGSIPVPIDEIVTDLGIPIVTDALDPIVTDT